MLLNNWNLLLPAILGSSLPLVAFFGHIVCQCCLPDCPCKASKALSASPPPQRPQRTPPLGDPPLQSGCLATCCPHYCKPFCSLDGARGGAERHLLSRAACREASSGGRPPACPCAAPTRVSRLCTAHRTATLYFIPPHISCSRMRRFIHLFHIYGGSPPRIPVRQG